MIYDTRSAQISQEQDGRNIYAIMKTMWIYNIYILYMYIYVYICIYDICDTYIYIYIYHNTYIYRHIYMYIYICICIYVYKAGNTKGAGGSMTPSRFWVAKNL